VSTSRVLLFLHSPAPASKSTVTDEEWRINAQLWCDSVSLWPATATKRMHRARMAASTRRAKEPVKVQYGYHLVTDLLKANEGNKSHKDVEATIIHHCKTPT
jgi:hypothetical protein